MEIEFDPAKNKANLRKHGIDFADIEGIFYDQNAITIEDRDHGANSDLSRLERMG